MNNKTIKKNKVKQVPLNVECLYRFFLDNTKREIHYEDTVILV
jgi:hypothetical protein